jgi:hypothetical protein
VKNKQRKVLQAIFTEPVLSSIAWSDIESLLMALGAERCEGSSSRVGFSLNSVDIIIQRPHPKKETDKGAVKSIRKFLTNAGVKP